MKKRKMKYKDIVACSVSYHLMLIQKALLLIGQDLDKKSDNFKYARGASCAVLAIAEKLGVELPANMRPRKWPPK